MPNAIRSFDVVKEEAISLADAARLLPRRPSGKKYSIRTIERWIRNGFRGVHLEGGYVGASLCTSRESLQRFQRAVTEKRAQPTRTVSRREHDHAVKKLQQAGF